MQGFIADLRRLAITCDFGAFLDRSLSDQLVFGLHSEQIRKTLLAEDSITLTRAMEIAQATESAFRDAKALQGATNATATVLQMSSSVQANHTGRPKLCSRCGGVATIAQLAYSDLLNATSMVKLATQRQLAEAKNRSLETTPPEQIISNQASHGLHHSRINRRWERLCAVLYSSQ